MTESGPWSCPLSCSSARVPSSNSIIACGVRAGMVLGIVGFFSNAFTGPTSAAAARTR
ncbi:hypothetical protein [Paenarthrobacter ureafaciens]|uniref:hypothetical protein n=1 Tax=Paenarthrobacter ureafaciens TaxID=37931 RepID=UPI0015F5252D|nr:hypothetical protein [Paenarthrobacter ureafaciens]